MYRHLGRRCPRHHRPDCHGCSLWMRRTSCHAGTRSHPPRAERVVLTTALRQMELGVAACGPILADTGCAGVGLPASVLRPGTPQRPALGRSQGVAFTGLQLPHPRLQVLVLGEVGRGVNPISFLPISPCRFIESRDEEGTGQSPRTRWTSCCSSQLRAHLPPGLHAKPFLGAPRAQDERRMFAKNKKE